MSGRRSERSVATTPPVEWATRDGVSHSDGVREGFEVVNALGEGIAGVRPVAVAVSTGIKSDDTITVAQMPGYGVP